MDGKKGNMDAEEYESEYLEKSLNFKDMIYDAGREKELLNGWWNFNIDPFNSCIRSKWYEERNKDGKGRHIPVDFNFDQWEKVYVPSCWNLQDEKHFYYEGSAVYTRTFNYFDKGEERVVIKFGAANYEAKVFLNKKYLGMHKGGSTPFYVEVNGILEESNRLIVVVNNTRKRTTLPCRNFDWFNYGGIYRDIELIRLPGTFIKDFSLNLVPGSSFAKLYFYLHVDGAELCGEALLEIDELNIHEAIKIEDGYGRKIIDASPRLWSPENPTLYDIRVSYRDDSLNERIGFREIGTKGKDIFLNGKKIYLRGICCHEESIENGKAITEEEIIENIRLAKDMNCNFIRLAHYPHTEKTSRLADELGIMLWEEIPVYWSIDFKDAGTYSDALNQLIELINRDKNRASVIIWSVGNENADTDDRLEFMGALAQKVREYDDTRLVSAACLVDMENLRIADRLVEHLDIIGINEYYGWYDPDFDKLPKLFENSRPEKPVIITEFGADAYPGARGTSDDLGTEDCQLEIYKRQVETIETVPWINGTSPWILYDFRSPRRFNELQKGYNTKGLLSADKKRRKLAYYIMKQFYADRITNSGK
ncbi:MAG: glycosyl hydrolase family 2 [Clostridiales bacterium GWC2_40_7]|nr:MAG: glycosyl hydrolase family 2 [Clostridiales bacterium GWC2_40_7]